MIAELQAIQAAMGSLKSAGDIAKALLDLKVGAEVQSQVIELNRIIIAAQADTMTAQSSQFELLEQKRELEGELLKLKDWSAEKQRYEFQRIDPGVFLAVLKQEFVNTGEPPHVLCPKCYDANRKSVFQATPNTDSRHRIHICPTCNTQLAFMYIPPKPVQFASTNADPLSGQ